MSNSTKNAVQLLVTGASGRMGQRIITLAGEADPKTGATFQLICALDRADAPCQGQPISSFITNTPYQVAFSSTLPDSISSGLPTALIDFSAPTATRALIPECVKRHIPMMIGTTGLTAEDQKLIDNAAQSIPILQATNTSLGVNVLLGLVASAAQQLGLAYDIEIVEAHHNQKKDAPSGTALSLAESICKSTGRSLEKDLVHGRHGKDALRTPGTIGMHAVRMGDVVGEHTVYFATQGERVEIKHQASNRDTFARGALRAAAWLSAQKPGRYTMAHVLGLSQI